MFLTEYFRTAFDETFVLNQKMLHSKLKEPDNQILMCKRSKDLVSHFFARRLVWSKASKIVWGNESMVQSALYYRKSA